jgi:hypothetical protein
MTAHEISGTQTARFQQLNLFSPTAQQIKRGPSVLGQIILSLGPIALLI